MPPSEFRWFILTRALRIAAYLWVAAIAFAVFLVLPAWPLWIALLGALYALSRKLKRLIRHHESMHR